MRRVKGNSKKYITVRFCFAIFAIISGAFLIAMIFYQFIWKYFLNIIFGVAFGEYYHLYQPQIYYPEIFIPEGITLLLLGYLLLIILSKQVRKRHENKQLNKISNYLCFFITIFFTIFIIGLIIAYYYLGIYNFFSPILGFIIAVIVIFSSGYILLYLNKTDITDKKELRLFMSPPIRSVLFKDDVLNYRIITAFLFAVIIISPLPMFRNPTYSGSVYWENEELPTKTVLPGMNATYNLTMEITGGQGTSRYIIVEREDRVIGNWTVNPTEIIVKPNEKKIITFTNYVPVNVTDKERYAYCFSLVEMDDEGLISAMSGVYIRTRVTLDIEIYNSSKSLHYNAFPLVTGSTGRNFYYFLMILSLIAFITWIVITILFRKNRENKVRVNIGDSNKEEIKSINKKNLPRFKNI